MPRKKRKIELTLDGKTMLTSEWAEKLGIREKNILKRIARGLPVKDVLSKIRLKGIRKPIYKNISGQKFGRLTILNYEGKSRGRISMWKAQCECGKVLTVYRNTLHRENVSCGRYRKEIQKKLKKTHGRSRNNPEYNSWLALKSRCSDKNTKDYKYYGGRGIKVCKRWLNSFEIFLEDMGDKPEPKRLYSIDRIDVNGNYEPSNCKWVTRKEQAKNKRNNIFIKYKGESKTVAEWSKELGIEGYTVYRRIKRGETNPERILRPLGEK